MVVTAFTQNASAPRIPLDWKRPCKHMPLLCAFSRTIWSNAAGAAYAHSKAQQRMRENHVPIMYNCMGPCREGQAWLIKQATAGSAVSRRVGHS